MSTRCPNCGDSTVHQVTPGVQMAYVTELFAWGVEVDAESIEFFSDADKGRMYQCTSCDTEFGFVELFEASTNTEEDNE